MSASWRAQRLAGAVRDGAELIEHQERIGGPARVRRDRAAHDEAGAFALAVSGGERGDFADGLGGHGSLSVPAPTGAVRRQSWAGIAMREGALRRQTVVVNATVRARLSTTVSRRRNRNRSTARPLPSRHVEPNHRTGSRCGSRVRSPSWPASLLWPQHTTSPRARTAHAKVPPWETPTRCHTSQDAPASRGRAVVVLFYLNGTALAGAAHALELRHVDAEILHRVLVNHDSRWGSLETCQGTDIRRLTGLFVGGIATGQATAYHIPTAVRVVRPAGVLAHRRAVETDLGTTSQEDRQEQGCPHGFLIHQAVEVRSAPPQPVLPSGQMRIRS